MTPDILSLLEEKFPSNRRIDLEGITLYAWRLELEPLLKLAAMDTADQFNCGIETCVLGVGDEKGPGTFDSERGRQWLRRHPTAVLEMAKAVQEMNELTGPSDDRKKSSETPINSDASSTSAETLDTDILGVS